MRFIDNVCHMAPKFAYQGMAIQAWNDRSVVVLSRYLEAGECNETDSFLSDHRNEVLKSIFYNIKCDFIDIDDIGFGCYISVNDALPTAINDNMTNANSSIVFSFKSKQGRSKNRLWVASMLSSTRPPLRHTTQSFRDWFKAVGDASRSVQKHDQLNEPNCWVNDTIVDQSAEALL